jgi:hypothetical protein
MDPYLENPALWPDVHQSLITYIRDTLQPELRPNYLARIGERVYIAETESGRNIYPDVTLLGRPMKEGAPASETPAAPVAEATPVVVREPFTLMLPSGEHREPYLEITHSTGREVVTVIEVLSPANKTPGVGYEQYRKKQGEVLRSRAHLVEIDLLSQGLFVLAFDSDEGKRPDDVPRSRYLISVSRAPDRTRFELYPLILPEPLPTFRIPLRAPDPDVPLNLQAVFNRCYENGRYADVVNYDEPPPAPLSLDEQHWVKTNLLKSQA